MSATVLRTKPTEIPKACRMVMVWENFAAYERGVEVCQRIRAQFSREFEIHFECWNFQELAEGDCARQAAAMAAVADIILISLQGTELPAVLAGWLEVFPKSALAARGTLVPVLNEQDYPPEVLEKLVIYLEHWAQARGLDFLPLFPLPEKSVISTVQVEEWSVTSISPEFPERVNVDHWGLNE